MTKHNHPTRDIKPKVTCPACDHYWDNHPDGDDSCCNPKGVSDDN